MINTLLSNQPAGPSKDANLKLLYQKQQILDLENRAIAELGVTAEELMERAGLASFRVLRAKWRQVKRIAIVCGKGNNGGDGYVLARLAQKAGLDVMLLYLVPPEALVGAAKLAADAAQKAKVKIEPFDVSTLLDRELIIDALLGTGFAGELSDDLRLTIEAINQTGLPILALDLPSGVVADTGAVATVAIKAAVTVTFIGLKAGLFTGAAVDYVGEIKYDALGLPDYFFKELIPTASLLDFVALRKILPPRNLNAHKGDFGRVLVVGGDYGMPGAVRIAAEAAARVGAGLMMVLTRPEHVAVVCAAQPELMCYGLRKPKELKTFLKRADVIALGPGLGQSKWSEALFKIALKSGKPGVFDADALNWLAKKRRVKKLTHLILTPHPGEAARLLKTTVALINQDRLAAAVVLQEKFGAIVVLKGAGSIVCGPNKELSVCPHGNPGMASAGMGDLLTGIIAALLAQGIAPLAAAKLGVVLHALAGDAVAFDHGQRGLLATDLIPKMRRLLDYRE